jgi:hypothetical protein
VFVSATSGAEKRTRRGMQLMRSAGERCDVLNAICSRVTVSLVITLLCLATCRYQTIYQSVIYDAGE